MKANNFLVFFICSLLNLEGYAQTGRQKLSLYAYNIGFSGITTGLGRAINKEKKQVFLKEFWTGFKHGCIGGTIAFGGKQLTHMIKKDNNLLWGWPSKIVHSYGVSVMENSAVHNNLFTSIRFPIGFVMIDADLKRQNVVKPKIMPGSLTSFVVGCFNSKLNAEKSLQSGTPYFEYSNINSRLGYAQLNTIYINKAYDHSFYSVEPHELIHILQLREYYIFNTYLSKTKFVKKAKLSKKYFSKVILSTIYPDMHYQYIPYYTSFLFSRSYYGNIFELEAQHFATNKFVQR